MVTMMMTMMTMMMVAMMWWQCSGAKVLGRRSEQSFPCSIGKEPLRPAAPCIKQARLAERKEQ